MRNPQSVPVELRAVCHNHTLDITQLSQCHDQHGRMELAKVLLEVMEVSSSKGNMDTWSLSL